MRHYYEKTINDLETQLKSLQKNHGSDDRDEFQVIFVFFFRVQNSSFKKNC